MNFSAPFPAKGQVMNDPHPVYAQLRREELPSRNLRAAEQDSKR